MSRKIVCHNNHKWRYGEEIFDIFVVWATGDFLWGVLLFDDGVGGGEDIIQGAGTAPDVWNDIAGAFRHNSRLSDMYAWTVINFFDFQYSFGVDTIFRVIDSGDDNYQDGFCIGIPCGGWTNFNDD